MRTVQYEWKPGALLPTPYILHWYEWRAKIREVTFETWLAMRVWVLRDDIADDIEKCALSLGLKSFQSRVRPRRKR